MIVKIHETKNGTVIAAIDSDLLDKKFEEGDFQLDLTVTFYKGNEMNAEEIGDLIRNSYGVNLVGEKIIKLAIDEGILEEDMIRRIAGVPYYQGTFDVI